MAGHCAERKNMENNQKSGKNICSKLFLLVLLLQIAFLICVFVFKKTGYHEDEYFTYGLSNSFRHPYLYGSDIQVTDNYDVWLTGKDFSDYIRTNEETKFRYDSVWYNQATDTNPPLHYAIIHTISSVFCGKFSWWYAFSVNLVCFAVFQLCFYLLNIQIFRSKKLALMICIFWGFTLAGQGLFLFLRMYAMLAAFTMAYVLVQLRLLEKEKFQLRDGLLISLTAFGGAMTQHLFLPFAFFVTALLCLVFLVRKQWKKLFGCGLSALTGIALSFAAFPQTFDHLFHSRFQYSKEPDIRYQIPLLFSDALRSLSGIELVRAADVLFYVRITIMFIIPIFLPLLYLFRKNILTLIRKKKAARKENKAGNARAFRPETGILLISCAAFHVLVSSKFQYNDFGLDSIRYLYHILPFILVIGVCLIRMLYHAFSRRIRAEFCRIGTAVLACCVLVFQNVRFDPQYVISAAPENGRISEYTSGQTCILLPERVIFLPAYCRMMEPASEIYETFLQQDYYRSQKQKKEYQKIFDKNEPFMLVFDSTTLLPDDFYENYDPDDSFSMMLLKKNGEHWTKKEIVSYFEELSGYTAEHCTEETTHFNRIVAYRFVPPTE